VNEPQRCDLSVNLMLWHRSVVLLIFSLTGDVLCAALALFGDLTRRCRMPHIFWWILWLAQIPLVLQIALGLALLAEGARPRTPYHLMYGGLILLTLLTLYGLRPGGAVRRVIAKDERRYRESRWLLLLCAFLAGLVGRAYITGLLGR
jgi:heme A synthase